MKKEGCIFCDINKERNYLKIYEDENTVCVLNKSGAAIGHLLVIPKNHYTILEQVPDFEIAHLFNFANKVGSAIFEALNVGGTNIIVENGVVAGQEIAHFMINVIPRKENDGVDFTWHPKKLSEEVMATVELQLKEAGKSIGGFEKEKKEPVHLDKEEKKKIEGENNYLIKHITRIP